MKQITTGTLKRLLENIDDDTKPTILVDGKDGYEIREMWITDLGPILSLSRRLIAEDAVIDWDDSPEAS